MKKFQRSIATILTGVMLLTANPAAALTATQTPEGGKAIFPEKGSLYRSNEVLVVYKENVSNTNIKRYIRNSTAEGAETMSLDDEQKMSVIQLDQDTQVKDAIEEYADSPIVEYVQPNYIYKLYGQGTLEKGLPSTTKATTLSKTWHLDAVKTGTAKKRYNDVKAKTGTSKVRVAVLDTGADVGHEDLQKHLNKSLSVQVKDFDTVEPMTEDLDYYDGHGTHVCGIIGATAGNGLGGSGVASSVIGSKLDLVAVGVFAYFDDKDDGGDGDGEADLVEFGASTDTIVKGINYAREIDADVINMSLGSYYSDWAEKNAIDKCIYNGITVVAAAGNDGYSIENYPAAYRDVIAVAASNHKSKTTDWSTSGSFVNITAPGAQIYSTLPKTLQGYDESYNSTGQVVETSGYGRMDGTSMASPVAAGVVAILKSIKPNISFTRLNNALFRTATDIGKSGKDIYSGHGIVNAGEACRYVIAPSTPTNVKAALSTKSSTGSTNYRRIKVSWTKQTGAAGYRISYKSNTASQWTQVNVKASANYKTFYLNKGKTYRFKVQSYKTVNGNRYYSLSSAVKKATTLKKVSLKVTKTGKKNNRLQWENIAGESGYQIYKRRGTSGKWTKLRNLSAKKSIYVDRNIKKKYKYSYKVRAYKTVNGKKVYGPWSTIRVK